METRELTHFAPLFDVCREVLDPWLFRGQKNSAWRIVPSLYRYAKHGKNNSKFYERIERESVELFFYKAGHLIKDRRRGFLYNRVIAQHFGVPTRLLDWTRDPLIALYFAVEDAYENQTDDGAVFFVGNIGLIENGSRIGNEIFGMSRLFRIDPPFIDTRVIAQRSAFTIHREEFTGDSYTPIDNRDAVGNEKLIKFVIPSKLKFNFRESLKEFGVTRETVYPELENYSESIRVRMGRIHPA